MAERLRRTVAELKVNADGKLLQLTVSMGLASWRADIDSKEVLLVEVDKALYAAKSNGRNRLAMAIDDQTRVLKSSINTSH
jgi:diguanylate cyclase (GGDEF)-like protein